MGARTRTPEQMYQKYALKIDNLNDVFAPYTKTKNNQMKARYYEWLTIWHPLEVQTRQVLDTVDPPVPLHRYGAYLAAARQMFKIHSTMRNTAAEREISIRMQTWVNRGLSLSVLERIRDFVFTMGYPAP